MIQDRLAGLPIPPCGTAETSRRGQRRDCRIAARALINGGEVHCLIVNLSLGGFAFEVDTMYFIKAGSRLRVTCGELGEPMCVVRWGAHPRYGAEFDKAASNLTAAHDFYHTLESESQE